MTSTIRTRSALLPTSLTAALDLDIEGFGFLLTLLGSPLGEQGVYECAGCGTPLYTADMSKSSICSLPKSCSRMCKASSFAQRLHIPRMETVRVRATLEC